MISCHNLTRRFGDFTAVDNLSFEIPAGSICAFMGPNGAGKSTTVNMLTGLLAPTSGDATVAGLSIVNGGVELKKRIGVLPANLGLFDDLTVDEHLTLTGDVYGLKRDDTHSQNRSTSARARSGTWPRCLRQPLLQRHAKERPRSPWRSSTIPPVLFLDEPFEAIDPLHRAPFATLLSRVAQRGHHGIPDVAYPLDHRAHGKPFRGHPRRPYRLECHGCGTDEIPRRNYFDLIEYPPVEDLEWLGSGPS